MQTPKKNPFPPLLLIGDGSIRDEIEALLPVEAKKATLAELSGDRAFVVDASTGWLEEKQNLLKSTLLAIPPATTVLTCSLCFPATEIASWTPHPERVVGFGYLGSLQEVGLVEIAPGLKSDVTAVNEARGFFQFLGKETEVVQDFAGLVLPRILCMIINEAASVLSEGIATKEDIDRAMRLGTNYPRGPLEWADQIGLDVIHQILDGVYREQKEDRYRPSPLLGKMVCSGWLGRKTGRGFYEYGGS